MKSLPAHFAGTSFMVFLMLSLSILAAGCGGGGGGGTFMPTGTETASTLEAPPSTLSTVVGSLSGPDIITSSTALSLPATLYRI